MNARSRVFFAEPRALSLLAFFFPLFPSEHDMYHTNILNEQRRAQEQASYNDGSKNTAICKQSHKNDRAAKTVLATFFLPVCQSAGSTCLRRGRSIKIDHTWDSPFLRDSTAGAESPGVPRLSSKPNRNGFPSKHPPRHVPSARRPPSRRRSASAALGKILSVRFRFFNSVENTIARFSHPLVARPRLDALRKFWTPTGSYWTEATNEQGFKYFLLFTSVGMVLWYKLAKWVEPNIVRCARLAHCHAHRLGMTSCFHTTRLATFLNDSPVTPGAGVRVGSQQEHQCQISDQPELADTATQGIVIWPYGRGVERP